MPDNVALRNDAAEIELDEATACVQDVCTLLVRAELTGLREAGGRLARAVEIFSGWPQRPSLAHSQRRLELHRSIQRAGRLLEAVGRWCGHRRNVLFPEQTSPPCYGANGRTVAAPMSGSMTVEG